MSHFLQKKEEELVGEGAIPRRSAMQKLAAAAYEDPPPQRVDGWQLMFSTPTLKTYAQGNTVVVAVRGTVPTDVADLKADAVIPLNGLIQSDRFKQDAQDLALVQTRLSPTFYDYYGTGHSLGGAIIDAFLRDKKLLGAVTYNPAVEPQNYDAGLPNQRIYQAGDPLYMLMGKNVPDVTVVPAHDRDLMTNLISKVPYIGDIYSLYKQHALDTFQGDVGESAPPNLPAPRALNRASEEATPLTAEQQARWEAIRESRRAQFGKDDYKYAPNTVEGRAARADPLALQLEALNQEATSAAYYTDAARQQRVAQEKGRINSGINTFLRGLADAAGVAAQVAPGKAAALYSNIGAPLVQASFQADDVNAAKIANFEAAKAYYDENARGIEEERQRLRRALADKYGERFLQENFGGSADVRDQNKASITLRPAHDRVHKYVAVFSTGERVPFGAIGYADYTQHGDDERRDRYVSRHAGAGENWENPRSAGALARWILWGPHESVQENLKIFKTRFNLN